MQRQFLTATGFDPEKPRTPRVRHVVAATLALTAFVGCGNKADRIETGGNQPTAGDVAGAGNSADPTPASSSVVDKGPKSEPLPPSTEVMNSADIVVPSFDPDEGEGTPILVTDQLAQPLGLDGAPVGDLSKAPFPVEYIASLAVPPKLFAFADYSLVALVYKDTEYGSLIVKEGPSAEPSDFDGLVKAFDDTSTPERYGKDPATGHEYFGADTTYGTMLVERVNGYVTIHANLDGVFVEITGVDKLLTADIALKLAESLKFSTTD